MPQIPFANNAMEVIIVLPLPYSLPFMNHSYLPVKNKAVCNVNITNRNHATGEQKSIRNSAFAILYINFIISIFMVTYFNYTSASLFRQHRENIIQRTLLRANFHQTPMIAGTGFH